MQKKFVLIIILLTLAVWIFTERPFGVRNRHEIDKELVKNFHYANVRKAEFYTGINRQEKVEQVSQKVYGAIVSHHFFTEREITNLLLKFKGQNIKHVVIVGPNHFNRGEASALISLWPYQTPWGVLEPDIEVGKKLLASGLVGNEERPFEIEHSISALSGFVKNIFPDSVQTAIILKRGASLKQAREIGAWLSKNLPEDSLVLASVDFSHHQDLKTTEANDNESEKILLGLNFEKLSGIEADSPQSLGLLFEYVSQKDAKKFIFYNTNSARLSGNLNSTDITSYFFGYFIKGE